MASIAGLNKWVIKRIADSQTEIAKLEGWIVDQPMNSDFYNTLLGTEVGKLSVLYDIRDELGGKSDRGITDSNPETIAGDSDGPEALSDPRD